MADCGHGRFQRDGHPDVLFQDPVSGAVQIWYLGGAQGNMVMNAVTLTGSSSSRIAAVAEARPARAFPEVKGGDCQRAPAHNKEGVWPLGRPNYTPGLRLSQAPPTARPPITAAK